MDSHSSRQVLEAELEIAKASIEEAGRKSDSENRKISNENRLLKSQLQALKEKSGVNEKYIESLKKDLKAQSEDKERATSQLEDSEEKLVLPKFTSTLKTIVLKSECSKQSSSKSNLPTSQDSYQMMTCFWKMS